MKLMSFTGTVQIAGVAVPVAYEPTKLTLDLAGLVLAVPEHERAGVAVRLLDALTGGAPAVPMVVPASDVVGMPAVPVAAPKAAVEAPPAAAAPAVGPDAPVAKAEEKPVKAKPVRAPRTVAKAPLHAQAPKVAPAQTGTIAAPLDVVAAAGGDDEDLGSEDDVADAPSAMPVSEDIVEDAAGGIAEDIAEAREAELPEAIRSAVRVRDVIVYLVDQGYTTKAQVIAECERLAGDVTVLGRMGGELAMRVERAAAVLGIE